MASGLRSNFFTGFVATSALLFAAAAAPAAADGDAPLRLSTEHLGMTSEDVDALEQSRAEAATVAPADSEFLSAGGATRAPAACPRPVAQGQAMAASFEQCVELAIRGGNGFGESTSVCRTIFPAATPAS